LDVIKAVFIVAIEKLIYLLLLSLLLDIFAILWDSSEAFVCATRLWALCTPGWVRTNPSGSKCGLKREIIVICRRGTTYICFLKDGDGDYACYETLRCEEGES